MKAFLNDERAVHHEERPVWWLISMVCFTGFRITGETAKAHLLSAPMKTRPGKHNWREEAYPECVWYHPMGWEPWENQWYKRKKSAVSRRPLLSASSLLRNGPFYCPPSYCSFCDVLKSLKLLRKMQYSSLELSLSPQSFCHSVA